MTVALSVIVPTRERAVYLEHCLRSCLRNPEDSFEIIVLDNASTDGTRDVVERLSDTRVRYARSDIRLSMRDNFERGLALSSAEHVCFLGDDDGLLPNAVGSVLLYFEAHPVDAVSADRIHYAWPDLLSSRKDSVLIPRDKGAGKILESRQELKSLLGHGDYYRLPCIYHGFVRRGAIERAQREAKRFFLSSQVDIFSAVALSMLGLRYFRSNIPLLVNGGSSRSNGASHFGGGSKVEQDNWKKEDEIGFLPGFESFATVESLIIESALRYFDEHGDGSLFDAFPADAVEAAMRHEYAERLAQGKPVDRFAEACRSAGLDPASIMKRPQTSLRAGSRLKRHTRSFLKMCPVDARREGIVNVDQAAHYAARRIGEGSLGLTSSPLQQLLAARRIAFGQ